MYDQVSIDLSGCTTWHKFMEIHYHRPQETDAQGQAYPEEKEITVIWMPAIWEKCLSTKRWLYSFFFLFLFLLNIFFSLPSVPGTLEGF